MKGINGIQTAEEIRKYDSKANIIFITGYAIMLLKCVEYRLCIIFYGL